MECALRPSLPGHAGDDEHADSGPGRVEAALAERLKQLEAVRAVTAEITQELDLTTLLSLLTRRAVELVAAAVAGAVLLWDETDQVLIPRAWHGYGEWMREVRLRLGEATAGTIAQRRAGLLINAYQTAPYAHLLSMEHAGATSIIGEPLLYHNRLVGVIVLNNGSTGQAFTTRDQEILTIFGTQAAIAIAHACLFEEVRQQTTRLEQANAALHREISERRRAEAALRQARDELATRVEERTAELRMANTQLRQAIAERQQAEAAMREIEAKYRTVVENANDAIVVLQHGKAVYRNQADVELLGYTVEETANRSFLEVVAPESRARIQEYYQKRLRGEAVPEQYELQLLPKDGRRVIVDVRPRIIQYQGQPATLVVMRDITERKRVEEALHTFAAQLQQSNRELQDFAYTASHDLQEPLRKIQAFGDRLKARCSEALSEQGRDYLERIQNAAQRMQTLIEDLLVFSRVTTKAQPFMPVDLAQVVHEVSADLEVRIEQTGGRVDLGELRTIAADPLQMRQLFQNLIGNALKFHRQAAPPVVTIQGHLLSGADPGPAGNATALYQITVADNGIGFDQKYLDRLFHVFQRLHSRSAYEGTGVGLAICRKIVERHGGHITAQSSPGQGATFIVTLPIVQPTGGEARV